MARTKAVPLRREPSDLNQGVPGNSDHNLTHIDKKANGNAIPVSLSNSNLQKPSHPASQEQAGLAQLVICVAGIYASL